MARKTRNPLAKLVVLKARFICDNETGVCHGAVGLVSPGGKKRVVKVRGDSTLIMGLIRQFMSDMRASNSPLVPSEPIIRKHR